MANRTPSLVVYMIGLVIVLAGVWVLFTQTSLGAFIPPAVVVAVLLLIVGIAVMASSDRFISGDSSTDRYGARDRDRLR
ncbi:MAG TPA: hypothetical protein VM889_02920 [Candidatus Thermoplasmatota archaeon]|nr:hypothetical protein [Candidatus Thermoplasmatota archaeon]